MLNKRELLHISITYVKKKDYKRLDQTDMFLLINNLIQYKDTKETKLQNGLAPGIPPPMDSDSDAISLAFLISLSVTFAIIMILLIMVAAYITFCSADESQYDEEAGVRRPHDIGNRRLPLSGIFKKRHNDLLLDASFTQSPYGIDHCGDGSDDEAEIEAFKKMEIEELKKMSSSETEFYERAKEFQRQNPPVVTRFGSFISDDDLLFLKDRGIQSYFLLPSINDNVDKVGHFLPSFLIQDKLDITFTKYNKSSSTILNYPLPYNKRDAVYFEVKVFKHQKRSNSIFSIGLTTIPYPYFRPPGMSNFSIAYESTGKLRINNPFSAATLLPRLEEGDIVGFGYRYRTGTIFITHNGKKLMDVTQNVHIDLFLSLGAINASYTRTYTMDGLLEDPDNINLRNKIDNNGEIDLGAKLNQSYNIHKDEIDSDLIELNLNLGQIGFVFIEANVKKYSFGSVFGEIGIPPSYNGIVNGNKDVVLQKGDELPPEYISDSELDEIAHPRREILEGTSSMLQGPDENLGKYSSINNNNNKNNKNKKNNNNDLNLVEDTDSTETTPLISLTNKSKRVKKNSKRHKKKKGKRRG